MDSILIKSLYSTIINSLCPDTSHILIAYKTRATSHSKRQTYFNEIFFHGSIDPTPYQKLNRIGLDIYDVKHTIVNNKQWCGSHIA